MRGLIAFTAEQRGPEGRGDEYLDVIARLRPELSRPEVERAGRTGHLLVAAELALALSVLVGAGLLVRSFARVIAVDPGFRVDHRLTLRVSLPLARYRDVRQRAAFYAQLFDRLSALPGVRAAGGVSELPLGETANMGTFEIGVRATATGADLPHADWRSASPRYFSATGLALVAGRLFDDRDQGALAFALARIAGGIAVWRVGLRPGDLCRTGRAAGGVGGRGGLCSGTPRHRTRSADLASGYLTARAWVVRIRLRFGMARRRIATAPGIRFARTIRQPRAEADLSLADLLDQKRHEQRDREGDGDQNADGHAHLRRSIRNGYACLSGSAEVRDGARSNDDRESRANESPAAVSTPTSSCISLVAKAVQWMSDGPFPSATSANG
jgi:hypothetical protein